MCQMEIRPGAHVGERWTPIDSVAVYSPRGKGSFPSVTLMSVVPAVVAGVPDLIVLTPPGPDGQVDAATLVAADIAGCRKVFKAGGAQAVAAAAGWRGGAARHSSRPPPTGAARLANVKTVRFARAATPSSSPVNVRASLISR